MQRTLETALVAALEASLFELVDAQTLTNVRDLIVEAVAPLCEHDVAPTGQERPRLVIDVSYDAALNTVNALLYVQRGLRVETYHASART